MLRRQEKHCNDLLTTYAVSKPALRPGRICGGGRKMREHGGKTPRKILRTGPFSQNSNFIIKVFHSNVDSIIDNK